MAGAIILWIVILLFVVFIAMRVWVMVKFGANEALNMKLWPWSTKVHHGHEPNADAKPVEVDHIELNVDGEKRY